MNRKIMKQTLTALLTTATFAMAQDGIVLKDIALNPEGIEYDKNDKTFLLSSLNAKPIVKVNVDGSYKPFASGEKFPLSTAGLQIDYKAERLLAAAFNGQEIMDSDPKTKGVSFLRIYNLKTGVLEKEINLSSLAPKANAYFANDVAVDSKGNVYVTDWYANLIYRVDSEGNATVFWENNLGLDGGPNGIDFHQDGYLLSSIIKVNEKGIYERYALVKIPLKEPKLASQVKIEDKRFAGFDGMVVNKKGDIIGVSNSGKSGGGNMLLKLFSSDDWKSASVVEAKAITPSTTVAVTPEDENYVINQDFSDNFAKNWRIEKIEF